MPRSMDLTHRLLPVLLAVGATAALAAPPAGAVVGGERIPVSSVPWFASVGGCGGTLVSPTRVLTAAHCVQGRAVADLRQVVVAGDVVRDVSHIAMHPNWRQRNGSENFLDDVAIVELAQPVTTVTPIALATSDVPEATITGTGRPFAPGTGHSEAELYGSAGLRSAPLRTLTDAECAAAFKGYRGSTRERFDKRMRCSIDADGQEPLSSGCNGDSGGPLWATIGGVPTQLGVVSWGGDRCGADHLPSVFADVARYRSFILDPSPTWAPNSRGTAKITGSGRVGRTLSCATPGYVSSAGVQVAYVWKRLAHSTGGRYTPPREIARGRRYTVTARDRHHRVGCTANAENAGGFVALGVASILVKG